MISFPYAKINLGLSIVSKRPDGFHNLETIFYPLPLRDVLEIVPSAETAFFPSGLAIPGNPADNLVLRAFDLLKKNYPQIGNLKIYLLKAIPMGAGLGGGSSDAAYIIQLINRYYDLRISDRDLNAFALALGSDCPFFMQSSPCFASGRGEILEPLALDLSGYSFLLVHPEIRIGTGWAFSRIRPSLPNYDLKQSISKPIQYWKDTLYNDFEKPVFEAYPLLEKMKKQLYAAGARYAAMTGSGSTIFGIFAKGTLPDAFAVEKARVHLIW
jgi:4-diphosphocytidyl-2-C-methyl-D-erythritol kinase